MWTFLLLILTLFCFGIAQNGFYEVVAPRVVRPNSKYHISVNIQFASVPTVVDLSIQGASYNGKRINIQDSLTVQPYTTRISRLQIGDIEPGDYVLSVQGYGGVPFLSKTPLQYVEKSYSVFIQTDKSIYKPTHKILFRAIVLNSQLKPAAEVRSEPLQIFISDGEGNKVKQWVNVYATKGVFTSELQLGKNLVLGNWNISVTIHGQTFNKTIEVAEYILPKFLINIQAPKHITFKENVLLVNIQSFYNYGKKVKGDATVTIYPTIRSGVIQPIFQNPIRKVMPIDGSANVEFDIAKELKLSDEYERTVIIDVTVEEALTTRRQNNSMEVHLHKYDYKLEIIKTADYYKPGLKYTAYIKVSNHDDTPVRNNMDSVKVRHGYSRLREAFVEEEYGLDKNGVIKLELYPPIESFNGIALHIDAEYMGLTERMPPVPAAVSRSSAFIQASLAVDSNPVVNKVVEIIINCTEPMKYINYQILGRGDVLLAHTFETSDKKDFRFYFNVTHAMVPIAHLLVNYIRSDGEIIADSLDIEIDGLVQNFVDIQINNVESQPEADIDMTIRAKSNSYIGLLAVDQNVGNVRSGYDITHKQVAEELLRYDVANSSPYSTVLKDANSHFFWKPGSSNTHDMFYDSGAIVVTNANVSTYRPSFEDIYLRPVSYESSTAKPDRGIGLPFYTITRPPLAGPYAFSRIPRPVWDKPKVYLNKDIEDTWLFSNFSLNVEGKTSFGRKLPNSLTTWTITGFSLDPLFGLGLINSPRKLKVSKKFVVTLDLPNSLKRDETLAVPIVVYNNDNKDVVAEVTIHNSEQKFKFTDISNDQNSTSKIELYRRRKVSVKSNSGAAVSFMITPVKLGYIELKVSASISGVAQDTITKNLLVRAEGETQYYSKSLFIDLRNKNSYRGNISFDMPKNLIPGSENIEASVLGDLLWPGITNLDNLIRLPTGCGEQNLIHFIPNILILNYLINTAHLSSTVLDEIVNNLEVAYQQQLTYKRPDGSFSAFGKRDTNSSVWITAYVASAFKQAKPFIYIDDKIISGALKWLDERQASDGSFSETGTVVHYEMQSGDDNLALTAFTILTFIENQKTTNIYQDTISKGLNYVARTLQESHNVYTIALCTYLLHIADHSSKQAAFNILDLKAQTKNKIKWWAEPIDKKEEKNPWNYEPRSLSIEATSYALLTLLERNLLDDALPIVDWLIQQKSGLGGFTSSQDTVVGMIALYKLVSKLSINTNVGIKYTYEGGNGEFNIHRENAMIDQRQQIANSVRQVNVTAQGFGIALFRVVYQYNVNVTGPWPMFTLDPQIDKNSNAHHLQLSICTAFVSRNLTKQSISNMAVMEVNFPSGFTADVDSLPSLEVSQNVKKVETKNGDTTVILYFNNLTINEYCPTVSAFRTHKVAKQKPVDVIIYDYYDSSRKARIFYKVKGITPCDICDEEDCDSRCTSSNPYLPAESKKDGGVGANTLNEWLYLIVVIWIFYY